MRREEEKGRFTFFFPAAQTAPSPPETPLLSLLPHWLALLLLHRLALLLLVPRYASSGPEVPDPQVVA